MMHFPKNMKIALNQFGRWVGCTPDILRSRPRPALPTHTTTTNLSMRTSNTFGGFEHSIIYMAAIFIEGEQGSAPV